MSDNRIRLDQALDQLQGTTQKGRGQGLADLQEIFKYQRDNSNLEILSDKSYHKIFETLFKVTLTEKQLLSSTASKITRTSVVTRLSLCGEVVRLVAKTGGPILKGKTAEAVVEHITQTLPESDAGYCEPLMQYYLKTLIAIFEHQHLVEGLKDVVWLDVVDFCLQAINHHLESNDGQSSTLPRRSSGFGTRQMSGSLAKSVASNSLSKKSSLTYTNVEDLFQTLLLLVSSTGALLTDRYAEVSDTTLRFLQASGYSVGQVHQLAFSTLNAVIRYTRIDKYHDTQKVAREIIPTICGIWRGKSLARDLMLNSVRDEIIVLILSVHLHLERCLEDDMAGEVLPLLEELADTLRADYAKRKEDEMLLLDHLDMTDFGEHTKTKVPFRSYAFHLMPHNLRSERVWAILQAIGVLERLVSLGRRQERLISKHDEDDEEAKHPRKRQRIAQSLDRLLDPIHGESEQKRTAGLQWIPFALEDSELSSAELKELLHFVNMCATDKRGRIGSWALLALASCTRQETAKQVEPSDWVQLWHVGVRALTFSTTCRCAAVLLHALIARKLVQYHDIGEDIGSIISAFDTNGPAILCDSSIFLMAHLLHERVSEVPGSSLITSQNVIRWIFARWNPVDREFAAHHAVHVQPRHLTDILCTCLGMPKPNHPAVTTMPCEAAAQAWQHHLDTKEVVRYILLVDSKVAQIQSPCSSCPPRSKSSDLVYSNFASFSAARKLILELFNPKCAEVTVTWRSYVSDRSGSVSIDTFRSGMYACITMSLLMPYFSDANQIQLQTMEHSLSDLTAHLLQFLNDAATRNSGEGHKLNETLLQSLQPCLPTCSIGEFHQLFKFRQHFTRLLIAVAEDLGRQRVLPIGLSSQVGLDEMDVDQKSPKGEEDASFGKQKTTMPRRDLALDTWSGTFSRSTIDRLAFIATVSAMDSIGSVPPIFVDYLIKLSTQDFLASRRLLLEILASDFAIADDDACRILEHLGEILSSKDFTRCEVALQACVDVMTSIWPLWSISGGSDTSEAAAQLYEWFIGTALEHGLTSPDAQKSISRLLLLLLHKCRDYGENKGLPSPRSSLLNLLKRSNVSVKFYIGELLPQIFSLFILKDHDQVFADIQNVLPAEVDWCEGIYFRLFVYARLASAWPNLLRRCIYHIFETAGRIPSCVDHASQCLLDISGKLKVNDPRELFSLFAPQVLFTWLEIEGIESMPFKIFGFSDLKELVEHAQEEATALMLMRGQEADIEKLAKILGIETDELLRRSFTKVMAYTIAHDISTPPPKGLEKRITGESRVRKRLGDGNFFDCINEHFADILAIIFNLVEREIEAEKVFSKAESYKSAAQIVKKIKGMSSSDTILPVNQQPTFRVRYLTNEIEYLCNRTQYEIRDLYTPALVVSIARHLLSTIHPALGSLHACSVIRKLRILIALVGPSATSGYPLEMLLQSVRPFITDTECADDAIGIMQYLLSAGAVHLLQTPSFLAGLSIAALTSLRTFLESHKASTTQESQYKLTMSRAHIFHTWLGDYLSNYKPQSLETHLKPRFDRLLHYAFKLQTVGNADSKSSESELLIELLRDEKSSQSLLSRPARKLALRTLASDFRAPNSFRVDALGEDDLSMSYAEVVWRSCKTSESEEYLSWSAKVLGRAFVASGHIHEELLRESALAQVRELSSFPSESVDSTICILELLREEILGYDPRTTGLAEIALRKIVTNTDDTAAAAQKCLPESLQEASNWLPYRSPPSEMSTITEIMDLSKALLNPESIIQKHWLRDLSIFVARSVHGHFILDALVPVLWKVGGFAERAFPFILHLVLSASPHDQKINKDKLSRAFVGWFAQSKNVTTKGNIRMLLNSILYLRTQPLAGEKSCADRARWLEIDYLKAATAATDCGMFKTSLLLTEEHCSQPAKSSRRSSTFSSNEHFDSPTELLLTIFENVDDPDMYYGVQQTANLNNILARFEYEKDGPKTLSFRGAQYDSHIRRHDPRAVQDAQSLVGALDVLNLSGLSHSLLQAQQTVGMTPGSLESMFRTARKLEQWDIPVPSNCSNNAITIYKTFQSVDTANSKTSIVQAVNEGLGYAMRSLVREDLSAGALHGTLQTLAALVEVDEVLTSDGSVEFETMLERFDRRSEWMKVGQFEDVSQILSCRATTLSTLSQRPRLHQLLQLEPIDTRYVEVGTALLSSRIHRAHNAPQESLYLATAMIDLIKPCHEVGIHPEAAIHVEAADSLWDQGEMSSSIGMLQSLENDTLLAKQTIKVGRSDLLAKIGHRVSVARLEKADKIIEKYLKPALKALGGKKDGSEASQVFHQFAVFCDQQLQDPDGLEDLERLTKLRKNKAAEVQEYDKLIASTSNSANKSRYRSLQKKAKTWLDLDDEELNRHNRSRDEFLRQCLENYLLALAASDDHDRIALRFSSLWLENSDRELANTAVEKHLKNVPSRKFAALMNQLSSRLQDSDASFQKLLFSLVLRICKDHPFHGMYQIYAGVMSRINEKDESAVSRRGANRRISDMLMNAEQTKQTWQAIMKTSKAYCDLAIEKDEQKYKQGRKLSLKESQAATKLSYMLSKFQLPPPTMQVPLLADFGYSKLPMTHNLDSQFSIASGVSAPKIITVVASDGKRYRQLVKGGNDDLRQDAIMEQVFEQVSELLKINRSTRQRNLSIRTYKVLPLTQSAGVIEFVANTMPLSDYIMPAHKRYYPKDMLHQDCRQEIQNAQPKSVEIRIQKFRHVTERFHPVMRYFFIEKFTDPDEWFVKRLAYSRSTAAISILGHALGLGDRHCHNILLDAKSGEIVHIDLGVAFEMGRVLPIPELVPFRLTRDIVDGMGITKTEGVFRRCCEFTLEALRKEAYSIMTILDVLRYDPLYSWSVSPVRLARLQQEGQSAALEAAEMRTTTEKIKEAVNEPGEADRALTVVNKKLSKTLSVTATVNDLINQATDERNLAVLFSGWAAYA